MNPELTPRTQLHGFHCSAVGALQKLAAEIFQAFEKDLLCPHYLRLCTECFNEACLIALADERASGSSLNLGHDRKPYRTDLDSVPEFQRSRVALLQFACFMRAGLVRVATLHFTVRPADDVGPTVKPRPATLGVADAELRADDCDPDTQRNLAPLDCSDFDGNVLTSASPIIVRNVLRRGIRSTYATG